TTAVTERLEKVLGLMESEISVLQVEKRIRNRVKRQMEKTQREYFLSEQMKAIQKEKEIGDEEGCDEFAEIKDKIKKTKLSKEAREKATHELKKLRQISPMSPEGAVVRNYLDWLLSIPWNKKSKINNDLVHAQQILDHDHYGVEKIKERIVDGPGRCGSELARRGPLRRYDRRRIDRRPLRRCRASRHRCQCSHLRARYRSHGNAGCRDCCPGRSRKSASPTSRARLADDGMSGAALLRPGWRGWHNTGNAATVHVMGGDLRDTSGDFPGRSLSHGSGGLRC